jgi:hypothetical protein
LPTEQHGVLAEVESSKREKTPLRAANSGCGLWHASGELFPLGSATAGLPDQLKLNQGVALKAALATPPRAPAPPENPEPLRAETFPVGPVGVFVRAPYSAKAVFGSVVPVLEVPVPPFSHAARKAVMPSTINPVAHRDSFAQGNNSRTNR